MHLYFIPRGIRQQIEMFEKMIQSQMFPWMRTNLKTGEQEMSMVQGAYRDAGPVKEYVFPKECLPEVIDMLGINPKHDYAISGLKMSILRKMVKAKKIPKVDLNKFDFPRQGIIKVNSEGKVEYSSYRFVETRGVAVHAIGIKDDKFGEMVESNGTKYYQELL